MKRLRKILERIEEATRETHIGWTQSEVSRYALEPVLQACGWDTTDPSIAKGAERNALWLHDGTGRAAVCAVARAQGASVEHAARTSASGDGEAGPAIQITTNGSEWRVDTTDGAVVTIGPDDGDADQRARALRRLIGEREIVSGRAMENLVSSALERNLKPAWEALRPAEGPEEEGDEEVAQALEMLTWALARRAGARSEAGVKRTTEFISTMLWSDTKGRRGGRRPSRLAVWRPANERGEETKIEHVMVKNVYAAALAEYEEASPGALERLSAKYPRDVARTKEEMRESVRERARRVADFWVECNLSAEEAEKRLREAFAADPAQAARWTIKVAPREDTAGAR